MYALVYSPNGIVSDFMEVRLFDSEYAAHAAMVVHLGKLVDEEVGDDPDYDDYGITWNHAYMDGNTSDGAEWHICEVTCD